MGSLFWSKLTRLDFKNINRSGVEGGDQDETQDNTIVFRLDHLKA